MNGIATSTSTAASIYYTITANTSNNIPAEISLGTHAGETQALSLENSATSINTTAAGGDGSAGKISYDSLVFTKIRGISSIPLWKILSTGVHLYTAEFKFYDSDDVLYFSIKLTDCTVVKIKSSAPELPGGLSAVETIALKPADKIGWKDYTTITPTTGTFSVKTGAWTVTY